MAHSHGFKTIEKFHWSLPPLNMNSIWSFIKTQLQTISRSLSVSVRTAECQTEMKFIGNFHKHLNSSLNSRRSSKLFTQDSTQKFEHKIEL